ncbi:MAG: Ig-like domain-containing protein, partial [Clostridia bacterium]|nr:Ig-like domain-containing protein [Clostridia bacterium]
GTITAVKAGTATITVTTEDGNKTSTSAVTVKAKTVAPTVIKVTNVSVSPTTLKLTEGGTANLTATVTPANATNPNVTWSSSNTAVATVDNIGTVTAVKAGTATITVTTADGGKTSTCAVTVEAEKVPEPQTYSVKFHMNGDVVGTVGVTEGNTVSVPANISAPNGYYIAGWTTSSSGNGASYNFNTPVNGNLDLYAKLEQVAEGLQYAYAGNECAAFEWSDSNASAARVEYKMSTANSYTELSGDDKDFLVRQKETGVARVDIVGLKKNTSYDFRITPSSGSGDVINVTKTIYAYDRSGYAHFGKTDGVGAYNNDGTVRSDATVIYVNEQNKNSSFTVEGKSYTGIVGVLTNSSKFKKPLIVRIVGTVGAATWNKIDYNANGQWSQSNKLPKSEVKGINGKAITGAMSQAELIAGGYNTLDESVYTELLGLSSNLLSSDSEFDSCWNDCSISGAKNVTVEGIGEDARIFQWGMTFKNSNSIEIRNLTFEDYTEDACSFEGGSSSTSSSSADEFTYKNFWIHHNTFEEGVNYWDVCSEQDKHDGDGSTDIKRVAYVTFSYNIYHNTHKTGLVGSDNNVMTAAVTFHHNLYDGCKARLPLARQANMHMYNNYYKGTTSTDISLRGSAYALVENCYFEGGKKDGKLYQGVNFDFPYDSKGNGQGWAKVIGCTFVDANGKTVDPKTNFGSNVPTSNLKLNASRTDKLNTSNKFGENFDTDSSVFYYDSTNKKSDVSVMFTAAQTKEYVPLLAGVQKNGGNVNLGGAGGGSTGTETETPDPKPNPGDETGAAISTTQPAGTVTATINDFAGLSGKTTATLSAGTLSSYINDIAFERVTSDNKAIALTSGKIKFESGVSMTVTAKSSDVYLVLKMSDRSVSMSVTEGSGDPVTLDLSTDKTIYIKLTQGTTYVITRGTTGNNDLESIGILLPN